MSTQAERIFRPEIVQYLGGLAPDVGGIPPRMEEEARRDDVPILTREQGVFLSILVALGGLHRVLEVGTGIGYGTLFLARSLPVGGRVVSIDISAQRQARARHWLAEEDLLDRVEFRTGPALEVLPEECRNPDTWDLILLDAVKEEYRRYAEICLPSLRSGGVLVADNLLWMGMVAGVPLLDESYGESTGALQEFNTWLMARQDLQCLLLPLGDGLGLARKN